MADRQSTADLLVKLDFHLGKDGNPQEAEKIRKLIRKKHRSQRGASGIAYGRKRSKD